MTEAIIFIGSVLWMGLLCLIERRLWGTIYTPLNYMMLPYVIVMILTIIIVKVNNFYPFNYMALVVWDIGLFFFLIPSLISQLYVRNGNKGLIGSQLKEKDIPFKFLFIVCLLFFIILYAMHLRSTAMTSRAVVGTDDFASESAESGIWGHLFTLSLAIEILCFRYLSMKNKWLIIPCLAIIVFTVLYQVKSYIIIPIIAAIIMNVNLGKLRITPRSLLLTIICGSGFFFLSYYISLVLTKDKELEDHIIEFICKNFLHYTTSGIYGMSMDISQGILEKPDWQYFFVPFINIYRTLTHEQLYDPIIPYYFKNTWFDLGTNVRSFMGTCYAFGGTIVGPVIVLLTSTISYTIRVTCINKPATVLLMIDAWWSAQLLMGWFDYHFVLLRTFEVIMYFIILYATYRFFRNSINTLRTSNIIKI